MVRYHHYNGSSSSTGVMLMANGAMDLASRQTTPPCLIPNGRGSTLADACLSPDEADIPIPGLFLEDREYLPCALQGLHTMRRNRQFCDVILQVGTQEVPAHRVVLACASPYLLELFTADDVVKGSEENVITYKLNGGFDRESLDVLVNYAYTGRLEVLESKVKAVYLAASRLKMERVVQYCAQFLVDHLDPCTAVEIRAMPGIHRNPNLAARVDSYISANIGELVRSTQYLALPVVQVEVLACSKEVISAREARIEALCGLVVDWLHRECEQDDCTLEKLTSKTHLLYLNLDNSLHDCSDIETSDAHNTEIIQDYKKMSMKHSQPGSKNRRKSSTPTSRPRPVFYTRSISEAPTSEESTDAAEWKLIASAPINDRSTLGLLVVDGRLVRLSIIQRLNSGPSAGPSSVSDSPFPTPASTPGQSRPPSIERSTNGNAEGYCCLPAMSSARCAVGCASLNDTLLVCGGYDRGECLKTVEAFNPATNTWSQLPAMKEARGRFDITVVNGIVYAIAGSNGTTELATAESFDPVTGKWTPLPALDAPRSNIGVCDLNSQIYCIGGWNGQYGMKQCNVYDPATKMWSPIASLKTGRYQAGVTAHQGKVYAVGGCDAWNCLSSVEVYDPTTNTWDSLPPMITARRGCGVAVFQGKLYVVGGSDGCHALCSTEIFDLEEETWAPGPCLTTSRANVGVAVVDKKLFAVGGFSGKAFLNSIEFLDPVTGEWTVLLNRTEDISKEGGRIHRSLSDKGDRRASASLAILPEDPTSTESYGADDTFSFLSPDEQPEEGHAPEDESDEVSS